MTSRRFNKKVGKKLVYQIDKNRNYNNNFARFLFWIIVIGATIAAMGMLAYCASISGWVNVFRT